MAKAIVLVLALAGCTSIGHGRVGDWPELKIVEHYVPHAEMRDRCGKYVSAVSSPEACAEFRFAESRCDIWYSRDFLPSRAVLAHERGHCNGIDHGGEESMQGMLSAWRTRSAH